VIGSSSSTTRRRAIRPNHPGDAAPHEPLRRTGAARQVDNGGEHAIKFTDMMLGGHRLNPDPVYFATAEDAIRRLS
jgi:hypothetical protein